MSLGQIMMIDRSVDTNQIDPSVLVVHRNIVVSTTSVKQPFSVPVLLMRYCDGLLVPIVHQVITIIMHAFNIDITCIICMIIGI